MSEVAEALRQMAAALERPEAAEELSSIIERAVRSHLDESDAKEGERDAETDTPDVDAERQS